MSEKIETPVKTKKSRVQIFIVLLSVLLLLLVYGGGFIALPIRLLVSYRDRNCDSVLSLNRIYTTLYPKFMEDASLSPQVKECESYVLAVSGEKNEAWSESYDAYQQYLSDYPGGIYAREAFEHSASVLVRIVEDQVEQKKYEEAIANLALIITDYAGTDASAEAWTLTPAAYTLWGAGLRASGDFEQAEKVFNDFKAWAEHYQRNDVMPDAKSELSGTYMDWGLALQSKKRFEDAVAKFEMAVSTNDSSESKAARQKAYMEWGNAFLEQKEFTAAVEKFELAIELSDEDGTGAARDALSNGYIQWSAQLGENEDYFGALEQLEMAKESASTDGMKQSVETAFADTYTAFSNSDGNQAKQVMADARQAICEDEKKPNLPIFGLNKDSSHVSIYGVEVVLPDTLIAKTPAEMKYVACITEGQQLVQRLYHSGFVTSLNGNYDHVQDMGNKYFVTVYENRYQLVWDIQLHAADTAREIDVTTLLGSLPPPFTKTLMDFGSGDIYGKPPDINLLLQWLQSTIK